MRAAPIVEKNMVALRVVKNIRDGDVAMKDAQVVSELHHSH